MSVVPSARITLTPALILLAEGISVTGTNGFVFLSSVTYSLILAACMSAACPKLWTSPRKFLLDEPSVLSWNESSFLTALRSACVNIRDNSNRLSF